MNNMIIKFENSCSNALGIPTHIFNFLKKSIHLLFFIWILLIIFFPHAQAEILSGQFEVSDSISDISTADLSLIADSIFNQDGIAIWEIKPDPQYIFIDGIKFYAKIDKNSNKISILLAGNNNTQSLRGIIPSLYGDDNYALSKKFDEFHKCYEYNKCKTLLYSILNDTANDLKAKSVISQAASLSKDPSYKCSFSDKLYILGYYVTAAEYDNNWRCFHNWPWGSGTDTCKYHPEFKGCEYSDGWVNVDISLAAENPKNHLIFGGVYNDNNEESRISLDNTIWLQQVNWGGKQNIKYGTNTIPSKITLYGRKTWSVTSSITWMAINADSVNAIGHITGDGPTHIDRDEELDVIQSINLEKGPIEWLSSLDNINFIDIDIVPSEGSGDLIANKNAEVTLTVMNVGKKIEMNSNWKLELQFIDIPHVGADLLKTAVFNEPLIVQKREVTVNIPALDYGELYDSKFDIILDNPDLVNYAYIPFSDKLVIYGEPVPNHINYENSNHKVTYPDYLKIKPDDSVCNYILCTWDLAKIFICSYAAAKVIKSLEVGNIAGESVLLLSAKLHQFLVDVMLLGCEEPEKRTAQFIAKGTIALGDAIFDPKLNILNLPNELAKVASGFLMLPDVMEAINKCSLNIMNIIAEVNLYGIPMSCIDVLKGSEIKIIDSAERVIYMNDGNIINGIPNSSALYIDDGERIILPGIGNFTLQIRSTKASDMEIKSITPKGLNNYIYKNFKISVINGTKIESNCTNISGFEPMKVDINGDDMAEYISYPEMIQYNNITTGILIDQVASCTTAPPGSYIDFKINITNFGNTSLKSVMLTDILPDDLTYISDNRSGSYSSKNITWNDLGPLNAGASTFIHLVTKIEKEPSEELINSIWAIGLNPMGDKVGSQSQAIVRVLKPGIKIEKMLGILEPIQYDQFCQNQRIRGIGAIDVNTNVIDKKLALKYHNSLSGDGNFELNSENSLSENAGKLQRSIGNNTTSLNLYENTKMTYSGETPLSGGKSLESKEFFGGIGARIQEAFSVNEMEKDQQTFFASTDPASNEVDQNKIDQLRNASSTHLVALETKNFFNGTWGTDASWHKIFYKDVNAHEMFTGTFEADKLIKFHQNPVPENERNACIGIDC